MSNEFDWEAPDEFSSSNFLREPGTYHACVLAVKTTDKDGKLLEKGGFRAEMDVLDGTVQDANKVCTQKTKVMNISFIDGRTSHKDGGRFCRQQQAEFFIAAGILRPEHVPLIAAKKLPKIDLDECKSRQVIIAVKHGTDPKYLNVDNVWHVDDPEVKSYPKSEVALALLPKDQRRTADELAAIKAAFAGKDAPPAAGNGSTASTKPAPVAPVGEVDISDC